MHRAWPAVLQASEGRHRDAPPVAALVDPRMVLTLDVAALITILGVTTKPMPLVFYATVAALLPVLLLAVVFQDRYFTDLDRRNAFDRFLLQGLSYILLLGEAAALNCLAHGADSPMIRGTVLLAVGVAGALLVLLVSDGPATGRSRKRSAIDAALDRRENRARDISGHTDPRDVSDAAPVSRTPEAGRGPAFQSVWPW
jgi:hypothetical protein